MKKISFLSLIALTFSFTGCGDLNNNQISSDRTVDQPSNNVNINNLLKVKHTGFTIWMDCDKRSLNRLEMYLTKDENNYKRHNSFYIDPDVPKHCQQTSTKTYKVKGDIRLHRGHMRCANISDSNKDSIKESNYMTNVLPQVAQMNTGSWKLTEEIEECYRDLEPLYVTMGTLHLKPMGVPIPSHGLKDIPSHFWKIIKREDRVIAWLIPNVKEATRTQLDKYLVSVKKIEQLSHHSINGIAPYLKQETLSSSWQIPRGCDKS